DDDKDDEENGGDDGQEFNEEDYAEETRDEESFDPTPRTLENSDDKGNGDEDLGLNIGGEEGHVEEEEEDELYKDVNINQGRGKLYLGNRGLVPLIAKLPFVINLTISNPKEFFDPFDRLQTRWLSALILARKTSHFPESFQMSSSALESSKAWHRQPLD
nr:hypothetical protein [Tanacetum cinerariifolium]